MEFRLVILSVACFSCLIPSAVSLNLLAAKAVAGKAGQDILDIGAKTLAEEKEAIVKAAAEIASIATNAVALKGQALTKAAGSIAGSIISGAASIGITIAKAGLTMIAAKFGIKPIVLNEKTFVFEPPVLQEEVVFEPVVVEYDREIEVPALPPISTVSVEVRPPVVDLPPPPQLSASWNTFYEAVPSVEFVAPAQVPCTYELVKTPKYHTGPLIETFHFGK